MNLGMGGDPYQPQVGLVNSGIHRPAAAGVGTLPSVGGPGAYQPSPGAPAGGGWQQMLMAALQDPQLQQMMGGQSQQAPMLQAPGLLMPQHQIQGYQPPPLTAIGGLLGGR